MPLSPAGLVRLCPNCRTERPVSELSCEGPLDGNACNWDLTNEPVIQAGGAPAQAPEPPPVPVGRRCLNGHSLDPGDEICLICGLDPAPDTAAPDTGAPEPPAPEEPPPEETVIDGWHVLRRVSAADKPWERFVVRGSDRDAQLTLYGDGNEPDPAVQEARRRLPKGLVPELLATGRFGGRAYEVVEHIPGTSLEDAGAFVAGDVNLLRGEAEQVGRILAAFAEAGLRHCDLRPGTLLLRQREPLELVVADFRAARLSDFDLETVERLEGSLLQLRV